MKRFALCLFGCYCGIAQAADSDITFHGTLVSPPACAISDGKTVEVEFRDVIIDNINGNNFRQNVPLYHYMRSRRARRCLGDDAELDGQPDQLR